jgi:hypothetical protein
VGISIQSGNLEGIEILREVLPSRKAVAFPAASGVRTSAISRRVMGFFTH